MKQNEPIKSIMTQSPLTANLSMKLSEARQMFINNHIHHLPVVNGTQLIGILSYTDILRIDSGELYSQAPEQSDALLDSLSSIERVMTTEVTTMPIDAPVRQAVELLSHGQFHAIPVVDEGNALKGIVTGTDVFKYFLSLY